MYLLNAVACFNRFQDSGKRNALNILDAAKKLKREEEQRRSR
jgi:hypothetical protein